MTTPTQIAGALDKVMPASGSGYNVVAVPGSPRFKIGRDGQGAVVLLTPAEDANNVGAPTRLRRLTVHARANVRIETSDRSVGEETVGLVELRTATTESTHAFCGVAATIVELISETPAPGAVRAALRQMIELFESRPGRGGSLLGLWGELLSILESERPVQMVEAWHVEVDDRFDFAVPSTRIEVKTTQSGGRVHEFDLAQLLPVDGAETIVVSIVTTATHAGSSVVDLVNEVQGRLQGRADLAVKLWQLVAATLGEDWINDAAASRWDRHEAVASLRVMRAASIPRVTEPLDHAILGVRLRVQCDGVPHLLRSIPIGSAS